MITSSVVATICGLKSLRNAFRILIGIVLSLCAHLTLGEVTPTGSYSTSIPIETPSFHGIAPNLSIEYSSQNGNGMLGVGWHLRGLSEIHTTSATGGAPQGTSTDKFRLDGIELIPCINAPSGSTIANSPSCKYALPAPLAAYTGRIESFQRIAFEPSVTGGRWLVWNKDGTKRTYTASRGTAQWNISEVLDVHGNRVSYGYTHLAFGASPEYLDEVTYNQTRIKFYWELRGDVISFAGKAGKIYLSYRLKSVDIQVEGKRLRAYGVSYKMSPGTGRSTLVEVAHYGKNATVDSDGNISGLTLPPTTMHYTDQRTSKTWRTATSDTISLPVTSSAALLNRYQYESEIVDFGSYMTGGGPSSSHGLSFFTGDFDGDGRADSLVLSVIEDSAVAGGAGTVLSKQNAKLDTHVRLASQTWIRGEVPFEAPAHWGWADPPFDGRAKLVKTWVSDVNGDGLDDLILLGWKPIFLGDAHGPLQLLLNSALSNGDGTFTLSQPQFTQTAWTTATPVGSLDPIPDSPICMPGDFDGNGRTDFACMFQDSGTKHFLGVAYANSAGGFSSANLPLTIAEDSGTAVTNPRTGNTLFFPFETRRMVTGDVNNDGQTDVLVLDLNQEDVSTCAQQHLGEDPRNYRDTCTIKYNLVTFISRGVGFDKETTVTPWSRDDFIQAVPGTLAAADLNGDGLTDAAFLTGPLKGDRFQTIKQIRTAIRNIDRSYQLAEERLPAALATSNVFFSLGDTNGDNRTDLMIATPVAPGGGVGCSSVSFSRAVLTTVTTNKNGSFNFPTRWDDCRVSKEVTDQWAEWTALDDFAMLQVGDSNGDGYTDFMLPHVVAGIGAGQALFAIYDRVAQPGNKATRRWISADVNGDGKTDFISIAQLTNSSAALTLIAQPNGGYQEREFPIGTFQNPSMRTWRIADVNGDGKADIVHVQCSSSPTSSACELEIQSFLSQGNGWFTREPVNHTAAVLESAGTSLAGLRIADVNRDGKTDLFQTLVLTNPANGAKSLAVRTLLSDGHDWTQQAIQSIDITGAPINPNFYRSLSNVLAWHLGDFDGDGRTDLLHIVSNTPGARLTTLSLDDGGWRGQSSVVTHPSVAGGWPNHKGLENVLRWQVSDVNGDGLSDLVRLINTDTTFAVQRLESLGAQGWKNTVDPVQLPSGSTMEKSFGAHDWYSFDVNGDGLADFVNLVPSSDYNLNATVLYASGTGFGRVEQININNGYLRYKPQPTQQFGDVKGTGDASLLYVDHLAGSPAVAIRSVQLGQVDDLLVEQGVGGAATKVAYVDAGRFIDMGANQSCALPLGKILKVVEYTSTNDGRSADNDKIIYSYACPNWSHHYRTLLGWAEHAAFKAKTANRPAFSVRTNYRNSDECLTQIQLQSITNAAGNFVGPRSIVAYAPPGTSPPFQCLVNYTQRVTHGSGAFATAVNLNTSFRYDEFGNVVAVVEDGFNGLARATLRNFKYAAQSYVVDVLATEQLHDGLDSSAPVLRAKIFCYDGDTSFTCSAAPTKGLRTALIDIWEQGTRITNFQYDTVGNLASIMDANNHGTAVFFDPVQRTFPVAVVNALSQTVMDVEWDRTLGKATQITGMNGEKLTFEYDEFGRVKKTVSPTTGTVNRSYEFWGDPKQQRIVETLVDGSADGLWTRQYLDGLGRLYKLERKSDKPNEILGQRFVYSDASFYPYRTSRLSRWRTSGPFRARAYTTYAYDEAGRLVQITHPGGTTVRFNVEASGNRLITTVIDEKGWYAQAYHDAFERLVETRSFDGSLTIATRYEYDGAEQMKKVVDANGNPTTYEWDRLGRNKKITDPNFGVRVNGYDLVGNLKSMTDARGRTTTFNYDALNRMTEKIYPTGQRVKWNYDGATSLNGRGRLTSFNDLTSGGCGSDPSGIINYDANGKTTAVARCIQGNRANFAFKYDPLGRLQETTYPDGEMVKYEYNAAGLLANVPGIVDIQQRDASGCPTRMVFGNGVIRRFDYDTNRDWLLRQTDRLGNKGVFDSTYTYEPNGLVKTVASLANQTNLVIQYDTVRRIKNLSGSQTQSWSYDRTGNIIVNSALGYYTYPGQGASACTPPGGTPGPCKQPHAAQTAGGFSLRYDDNGLLSSMTNNNTGQMRTIDWTFDMLPSVVLDFDGTQTNFDYDAFGDRAVETRGQETIVYFGALARKSSLTGFTNTYVAADRTIASKTGGARIWMHHDRNGSVRAVTDANGLVVGRMDYGPFGEVRSAPGQSNRVAKFDGIDIDGGTGLQYMGARFYDPILNRFISPDAIVPDALNTQASNRYTYNHNNPLAYADPSGHQPIDITSSYYGAWTPTSGFNFSVHGYSAMPGTVLTSASNVSQLTIPTLNSPSAPTLASGENDAGYYEPPPRIRKVDDLGIEYDFPDSNTGWSDFLRAERTIRKGMKESPKFAELMWDLRRAKIATQISLDRLDLLLRGGTNAKVVDLQGSSRKINLISILPSRNISGTYLLLPASRSNGYLTIPDGGIAPGFSMPGNFETTLFHEFGHIGGALRSGRPVSTEVGPNHAINVDAVWFMGEGYRVFDVPLTTDQEKMKGIGLHPPSQ